MFAPRRGAPLFACKLHGLCLVVVWSCSVARFAVRPASKAVRYAPSMGNVGELLENNSNALIPRKTP
jgi:hypothetical protein